MTTAMPATRAELLDKLDALLERAAREATRRQLRGLRRQLLRDTLHALLAGAVTEALMLAVLGWQLSTCR